MRWHSANPKSGHDPSILGGLPLDDFCPPRWLLSQAASSLVSCLASRGPHCLFSSEPETLFFSPLLGKPLPQPGSFTSGTFCTGSPQCLPLVGPCGTPLRSEPSHAVFLLLAVALVFWLHFHLECVFRCSLSVCSLKACPGLSLQQGPACLWQGPGLAEERPSTFLHLLGWEAGSLNPWHGPQHSELFTHAQFCACPDYLFSNISSCPLQTGCMQWRAIKGTEDRDDYALQ